jgi:hypothetical protein
MAPTYGFKDMRTPAELMLAPGRPKARVNLSAGSLRLDIGGLVPIPGVLTGASQITGSIRQVMGAAIAAKQAAQMVNGMLQQTVDDFDRLKTTASNTKNYGPAIGATAAGQIPGTAAFFQVSAARSGASLPASYQSLLTTRRAQLGALKSRVANLANAPQKGGVQVTENYARTPYPLEGDVDLPSVAKAAVGGSIAQKDDMVRDKAKFIASGVPTAKGKPSFWSRFASIKQVTSAPGYNAATGMLFKDRKGSSSWSEPPSAAKPQFPYNKVTATESGHVIEIDDTPGAERIHVFHRSGSFIEFFPNGDIDIHSMKKGYIIAETDLNICANSGQCNIFVAGNATIKSLKDINVEADGDINFTAKKDFNVHAANVNLRAKKTFKGDGMQIDLRYINLPTMILPVMGGLVPMVNLAALKADFPSANIDKVLQQAAKGKLDPKTINTMLQLKPQSVPVPAETPLSNPMVYAKKSPAAADYRSRLFDTPEEAQNFEIYSAHIDLQKALGDVPTDEDTRALGGQLVDPDTSVPQIIPDVTYLNFDDYSGKFEYDNTYPLGNTSFVLQDLVDTALFPDVVSPMKDPPIMASGGPDRGQGNIPENDQTNEDPNTSSTSTAAERKNARSGEAS